VISVAIGELKVGTLEDVYNMSWAEFRIRLFAFKRMERNKIELLRIHAYHAASGGLYAMNPKLFPKSIDKFWKLPKEGELSDKKQLAELLESERKKMLNNG